MKFTAVSADLFKALSKIIGVVPSKSTLPILENVLFSLSKNRLTLTASDLDIYMAITLEVGGAGDGRIAIPARKLSDTLRALPSTEVTVEADLATNRVTLKTDQGTYRMTGDNASNFPETERVDEDFTIDLESPLLKSIIAKTSFAVSTDDLRPAMKGVLFQWKTNEFRAVSTDGHRLVRVRHVGALSNVEFDGPKEVIIPSKALNLVQKSVDNDNVSVIFGKTNVRFAAGDVEIVSRIIDERYPNYEGVIPLENTRRLEVNRSTILSAIKRCSIFSNAMTNQIRLGIAQAEVAISAEDADMGGEANETIPAEFSQDEGMEIGFNARYLEDALNHIDEDDVSMFFSTPTRAGLIQPKEQSEEMDILMLVMPLRLNAAS